MIRAMTLLISVCGVCYSQYGFPNPLSGSFGPYRENFSEFEICKGSKLTNASIVNLNLFQASNGSYLVQGNLTILKKIENIFIMLKMYKWIDRKFVHLLNVKASNLCKRSQVEQTFFKKFVNMDSKCVIQKGSKTFIYDMTATCYNNFNGQQLYGKFCFTLRITTPKDNVMCGKIIYTTVPK